MFKKIVRFNDCHNTMDVECLYKCSRAVMDNLSDNTTLPPGAHDLVKYSILITKLVSHTWLFSSWIDYPSQQVSDDQSSLAKDSPLSI